MRQPTKPKPRAVDEVARVIRTFEMLIDEINRTPVAVKNAAVNIDKVFEVAERIAARTED